VLLRGRDGSELELHVVGYQFPHNTADPWDSNSLLVAVRVLSPHGTWQVVDPCLTTWEAAHLVQWLAALARGDPRPLEVRYDEPNVRMWVKAIAPDLQRACVRACFELETRPPWLPGPAAGIDTLCVELDLTRADLGAAASDLARELRRFPQRGDDPTL
jgi:hypothetical protein